MSPPGRRVAIQLVPMGIFSRHLAMGVAALAAAASCNEPSVERAGLTRPDFFDADLLATPLRVVPSPLGGAVTSTDPARGTPRFVWAHAAPPPSLLASVAQRRQGATNDAAVAALWHLSQQASRWNLDEEALDGVYVKHVHDLGDGAIVVKLQQRVDGIDVARTSLSVVMNRSLELVALSGGLHAAARPSTLTARAPAIAVTARDAIERAFADAGAPRATALMPLSDAGGYQRFAVPGLPAPVRVKPVYYPVGTELVRGWNSELIAAEPDADRIQGYRHVFAADDGRLLQRVGLTSDQAYQYRVWANPTGDKRFADGPQADATPHPAGAPNGFHPAFVAPSLVTMEGFNRNPAGMADPWLPAGATVTTGNNVDAYADVSSPDHFSAGDIRPTVTAPGVFDRTYDTSAMPTSTDQRMAATVQLFYTINWLHNYFYDSGFNESAGNAQASNFGRGGAQGDVLLAEGQDYSGTDNANMTTPADGGSPFMQMYTWSTPIGGGANRDGTIDNQIISHEWGHYFHHRLVDCGATACRGMSEGWGDFISMIMSVNATDALDGTWGMGGYPTLAFTTNSTYFGIRRYPHSNDMTKSPLTFRFVQNGVALPSGPPRSDAGIFSPDNWQVHNAGEIWCEMLWSGLVDILKQSKLPTPRYTFEQARRRYANYLVAGMLATPVEPNHTEQRDAILAAAAASDPQDFVLMAQAYARRGFGSGAVAPAVNSTSGAGVVENFQVTGTLAVDSIAIGEGATPCDDDDVLDVGEEGVVSVTVRNTGAGTLTGPTISLASSTPGVVFPAGASVTVGSIAPFATATGTIAVRLDEGTSQPQSVSFSVTVTDASAAISSVTVPATERINLDIAPNASRTETFEAPVPVWTASSGWARSLDLTNGAHRARVRVAVSGDHTYQTPALQVTAGANLTLAFAHRYQFSAAGGFLDGGVVEYSTNGTTWTDVATLAPTIPYTGAITGAGNPLLGRAAFAASNATYPALANVSLNLGTSLGGMTVYLRFRAGGDTQAGSSVWEIDDVAIGGIDNMPFPSVTLETDDCLVGSRPVANAGANVIVQTAMQGMLDGSASMDPDQTALTYTWSQLSGVSIALSSNAVAQPTFTAPTTTTTRTARFQLIVRDADNRVSAPAQVTVTIIGSAAPDAPTPDAPPVPVDAAEPAPDAPVGVDAAPRPDAGGGNPNQPGDDDDGGGCCGAGKQRPGGMILAFVVGMLLIRRRRRS